MRSIRLFSALVLFSLNAVANVVPSTTPIAPASREEVRKELAAFFGGGGVGDLKKAPGVHEAVQKRIAALSDEELSNFQTLMTEMPNWRTMREDVAAALPPDVRKSLERAGAEFEARIPDAERMRDDVRTIAAVLRVLPDAKLKELSIDRKMLDSLDGTFAALSPMQAVMLQKQLADISTWSLKSASLMNALPSALRGGALALAKHGPLTDDDRKSLEQFRTDLVALLGTVKALPPSMRTTVRTEPLQEQIDRLSRATPEILFMIRDQFPAEKLAALRENAAILDRAAQLSDEDRAALETYRAEVIDTFAQLQQEGTPDDVVRDKIAQLSPTHLLMLQQKLAAFPEWKEMLPLYYRAISAPDLQARLAAVRGPAPDPERIAALQTFRAQALQYIQASAGEEGVDAALVQSATKAVTNADPVRLEFIRSLTEQMGNMRPESRLRVVSHVNFNCDVDIGVDTISLDFICDPIENAIEGAISGLEEIIDEVKAELEGAINVVATTVNTLVDGIIEKVEAIVHTVDEIWSFIHDIPDLAWDVIEEKLGAFLDISIVGGFSLRELAEMDIEDALPLLKSAARLTGSWWNDLLGMSLPTLPCPPMGLHTPFGNVGDTEADQNFKRYDFLEKFYLELIIDSEVTFPLKVAIKKKWAPFAFLGICLSNASETSGLDLQADRHDEVTDGIDTLETQVATTTTALSLQLISAYNNLIAHGNAQTTVLSNQLTASTNTLMNEIDTTTTALSNQVDTEATAQRDLDLRLQIELNLQAGEGKALAMFQLLEIHGGYLGRVRDTVQDGIASMLAAGQSVNQAQKYFNDAQTAINQARYKDAFRALQTAYRELAK